MSKARELDKAIDTVGFIGLGIMGMPMARNLLKAGYKVVVFTRTKEKMDLIAAEGALRASSAAEVAGQCPIVITMLTDSDVVELVAEGPKGIFAGALPGTIIADMSTISPVVTRRLAATAREKSCFWIDAPVSGGEGGAIAGTLTVMVGGEPEVFARALPIFQVMGKRITYLGPSGQGQSAKLCNQIVVAINLLAVSEALVFAAKEGLPLDRLLEALTGGAANSFALQVLAPKMLQRDFSPGFMVRLQTKDLKLVEEAARDRQVPLPGTSLAHQLFRSLEANGRGSEGNQALITVLETLAHVEAKSTTYAPHDRRG